ncbi:MAG: GNAT family N-acetyltransferase [Caulobacterales bacterium]
MKLRRGRLEDMAEVARLHRHTVRTSLPFLPVLHTPQEDFDYFSTILFAKAQFWLAEDEPGEGGAGEALGYIAFRPDFIEHLFIRPDAQGQGIGPRLLEKAREGAAELSLWTFQQNLRARRFYERHGFVVVTETDGADNEERMPDVLYRWRRAG